MYVLKVRNFGPRNRPHSSCSNHDDFNDMEENEFCSGKLSSENSGPVNLYVSNLDYNISSREWRKILASTFQPHIQVLRYKYEIEERKYAAFFEY